MIQENELIMLLIGIGTFIFILINYSKFNDLPKSEIIIISFTILVIGWFFTILEGFFYEEFLNFIEHSCYAIASILLAIWFIIVFRKGREDNESNKHS